MAIRKYKVGPGEFRLIAPAGDGGTATPMDFSCQLTSCTVAWEDDTEDNVNVLCGDEEPGDTTWTATISGEMFQDITELVPFTWTHKGEKWQSEFTPNTDKGKVVRGNVIVKPLDVGGDVKTSATTEFEWSYSGEPTLEDVAPAETQLATGGDDTDMMV